MIEVLFDGKASEEGEFFLDVLPVAAAPVSFNKIESEAWDLLCSGY